MATFPAIVPDERSYTLGAVSTETYVGPGGVPYVFRTGNIQVGAEVQLPFTLRPISEVEQIWDHYHAQQREPFDLPVAAWCGHTAAATIAAAGLLWSYAEQPTVDCFSYGTGSITVHLRASGTSLTGTSVGAPVAAIYSAVSGSGVETAPVLPQPVPDPPIVAPTITIEPPTETELPAGVVRVGSAIELRTGHIMEAGLVHVGGEIEVRTGHIMGTGLIRVGSTVTISTDEL